MGLPESPDLAGTSLYVAGTATASGGGDPIPFLVWSSLPVGALAAWSEPVSALDTGTQDIDVTITRDLGTLFEGVDFATMTADNIQKTMLLGLVDHLTVTVEP